MQRHADHALELEVLIRRAARGGWLDLDALSETYAALAPSSHPLLADPRRVDVAAVVAALKLLPTEVVEAERILVVPRLAAFPHEPLFTNARAPAGRLADGTILVEAPLGLTSLVHLAAALCALEVEVAKAAALTPPELARPDADEDEVAEEPEGDMATEADAEQEADAATEAEAGAGAEAEAETGADDEAGADDDDDLLSSAFSLLAFAWGTDVDTLRQSNAETHGAFLQLLLGQATLPEVEIHAGLDPRAITAAEEARAQRVVEVLAEQGLVNRPLHLWIGSDAVTDCLSPYPRDLRDTLSRWAELEPQALGEDLRDRAAEAGAAPAGEDVLTAIAHDFLGAHPELVGERAAAERSVGIVRHLVDDLAFETLDLARLDPAGCDARIAAWDPGPGSPVLLRLPLSLGDPEAGLVRALCLALGARVASVTVVLEGSVFNGQPGSVVLPHLMVAWAGEQKLWLPTGSAFDPDEVGVFTDRGVRRGAVLSLPSEALVSIPQLAELSRAFDLAAVEVGGAGVMRALADALWSGALASDVQTAWAVVGAERLASGRPTVASLAGFSALAIAKLRHLAPRAPEPEPVAEPEPEPPPAPVPRKPSPRAIRIKA